MASTSYAADTPGAVAPAGFSTTDVLLLFMALIWGLNFIVVKHATGVIAPLAFNSTRILLAVVVLWAIVIIRGNPLPPRADVWRMLALGVLGNGLYQIFWVKGLALTRASDAALLVAASPAFIEIIGALRGQERARRAAMTGIAISLVGIALVVTGGTHAVTRDSSLQGNLLILLSCLCWALFAVLLKPLTERIDGITLSAVTMTGGFAAVGIAAIPSLRATNWSGITVAGWGAVFYSGVMALVVAYLFWYKGVKLLGPMRAAMYSNLQPLITMIAAWALINEVPRAMQLVGGAFIIGGLLLTRITALQPVVAHE